MSNNAYFSGQILPTVEPISFYQPEPNPPIIYNITKNNEAELLLDDYTDWALMSPDENRYGGF